MTFAVTLGWWLLPLAVTIAAYALAFWHMDNSPSSGYGSIGKAFGNLLLLMAATIGALIAWVVYAFCV